MAALAAYDLKIGMEFKAQGTAGNLYKIILIDWAAKDVRLKRLKDGRVYKYDIAYFIEILPTYFNLNYGKEGPQNNAPAGN